MSYFNCEFVGIINKCGTKNARCRTLQVSVTPNIKVQMFENVLAIVYESQIMCGIEIWVLNGARKEIDKVYCNFCKKIIGIPNCAVNGFAEMELGRESRRRGKCLGQILKY